MRDWAVQRHQGRYQNEWQKQEWRPRPTPPIATTMEHVAEHEAIPSQLPNGYGPYEEEDREPKKKKKSKRHHKHKESLPHVVDGDGDDRQNGEVKKKKKKDRYTEDGVRRKKKKRTPEEELTREAARRKRASSKSPDSPADVTKSSSRRRSKDSRLPSQYEPSSTRTDHDHEMNMRAFATRQMSRELQAQEIDAAFGVSNNRMSLQPVSEDPSVDFQDEINWETGEGLAWPDDNDVSVITPLTAFDEPTLREDVEDPFVPVTTQFSGSSSVGQSGRAQWQPMTKEDNEMNRAGAHRVNPRYQAPGSKYSDQAVRRSSAPQSRIRTSPNSLLSEKRRNTLPPSLYPIAESYEWQDKKSDKKNDNGPLALFPVDESYEGGTTTKQKSHSRLSFSSTGESYAQFETDDATPGGTYIATRRISGKRRRKSKDRQDGPSYFQSRERYGDDNLMEDPSERSAHDIESLTPGEKRLGAFAVRRSGTHANGEPGSLTEQLDADRMDQLNRELQNVVYVDADERDESTKMNHCFCSTWFKFLMATLLLAGIAVAIAVPLTLSNSDNSVKSFSAEEAASRKKELEVILQDVSDANALVAESSPQYAAC